MKANRMIETYKNSIKELFERWRNETGLSKENFSEDGIIDPTIWFSEEEEAKPKILFVLKETNSQCNLPNYLRSGKRWQTWNNITRWAYLLRHLKEQPYDEMWRKVSKINQDNRRYHLSRIAVINVKKQPGSSSTDTKKLITAFEQKNQKYLPSEIALLGHLDYIVCCGVGVAHCLSQCYKAPEGTTVIKFKHPQTHQAGKEELFKELYNISSAFIL